MKITGVEKLEDCFDGSQVFLYHFDEVWTQPAILALASLGKLDYFSRFPRPFDRLRGAGGLQLKGVEGMQHCRVIVPSKQEDDFRQKLQECLVLAQPHFLKL